MILMIITRHHNLYRAVTRGRDSLTNTFCLAIGRDMRHGRCYYTVVQNRKREKVNLCVLYTYTHLLFCRLFSRLDTRALYCHRSSVIRHTEPSDLKRGDISIFLQLRLLMLQTEELCKLLITRRAMCQCLRLSLWRSGHEKPKHLLRAVTQHGLSW